jgi:acetylglutamate kinase
MIAEDGEGATKTITVRVSGASDDATARDFARAIAGSTLVKAAVFGSDPNWGRVLATVGARAATKKVPFEPRDARVSLQGTPVFADGEPVRFDAALLRAHLRRPEVLIEVRVGDGAGQGEALGCDLSYDYVKINADYASTIHTSPEGVVARDDRLASYTPALKRAIVVEALSYIAKFTGKRAVVCVRGESLVKDALKASFAADMNLLVSAGLQPIVVHGGGPEITRTLERLGAKSPIEEADPRLVEMVLSGRVNGELVTLLNQESARAVGISGKDGGLLRVKRGEPARADPELLELLLGKGYVPVIAPIALGDDGEGHSLETHAAAAAIALCARAEKLIYLADAPGILEAGELLSELTADELRAKIASGVVSGGMLALAESVLRAVDGGVPRVHVVDGRVPHGVVAELFTDRGVGTLVTR